MARFNMYEGLNENPPIDVMPASNLEHWPTAPTEDQKMIMRLQNEWIEDARQQFGMSRRQFVRTGMAMALGVMAVNAVSHARALADDGVAPRILPPEPNAPNYCNIRNSLTNNPKAGVPVHYAEVQLENLPGEFIFDLQSHHVEDDGFWRVTRPVHQAVIGLLLNGQGGSNAVERDVVGGVNRIHYMKDLVIESSTTAMVLSPVPAAPDFDNPLPVMEAVRTAELVEAWTGTMRCVIHSFVMPNLYSTFARPAGVMPLGFQGEMDRMWYWATNPRSRKYLRGWKTYSPYADVPFAPSWQHHDDVGTAFAQNVWDVYKATGVPPTIATHKGPTLPGFHPTSNSCVDIGPAAKIAWENFRDEASGAHLSYVVYHSGHDSGASMGGDAAHTTYPVDQGRSADNPVEPTPYSDSGPDGTVTEPSELAQYNNGIGVPTGGGAISVNSLIRSLRRVGFDGPHNKVHPALSHGNTPNVYGEIGSTWRGISSNRQNSAGFFGKMIWHVGPQRMVWGTDCLWYGSPQQEILLLRTLAPTAGEDGLTHTPAPGNIQAIWDTYRLPFGLNGDRWNPQVLALDPLPYTPGTTICDQMVGIFGEQSAENPDGWPTDERRHPERTIRNGIFGRNAAKVYGVDPDADASKMACERLNEYRNNYWVNQYTDTNRQTDPGRYDADPYLYSVPRANSMPAPRTPADVARMKKEEGWTP